MTDYGKFTGEELTTFYRNARKTASGSAGTGKRLRNHEKSSFFQAEMEARGLPVPSYEECDDKGEFNGPGSA